MVGAVEHDVDDLAFDDRVLQFGADRKLERPRGIERDPSVRAGPEPPDPCFD